VPPTRWFYVEPERAGARVGGARVVRSTAAEGFAPIDTPAALAPLGRRPTPSVTLHPATPVEHLGEAIAELASRIHAATYELLVMLRQFDAECGWN
jgi:hypothetical protein